MLVNLIKCYFCGDKATEMKYDRPMCAECFKLYERVSRRAVNYELARRKEAKYRKLPL